MKIIASIFCILLVLSVYSPANAETNNKESNYIVTFKNNKVNSHEVERAHGDVTNVFKNVPALTAELTQNEVNNLKKDKNLVVEEDLPVYGQSTQTLPWGIQKVHANQTWSDGYTGRGVKVAILDTGIEEDNYDLSYVTGQSFVSYTNSFDDDNGHGTHIAGIIAAKNDSYGVVGVAPDVQLYVGKVLDSNNSGYTSDVVKGIDWAISNNVNIINLSMKAGDTTAMETAINLADSDGILVVAAAGNSSSSQVDYPAKYSSVIAVGSVDYNNNLSYFSNYGPDVDVVAPGQSIVSDYTLNRLANLSGTSMAAPHVVGVLALYKEVYPTYNANQLKQMLFSHSLDLGALGRDDTFGYGLVDGYIPPAPINLTPPAVPTGVKANSSNGLVSVSWNLNKETDVIGYNVYIGNMKMNSSLITNTNYTINGLQRGQSYYVYVTAVNRSKVESNKSFRVFVMVPL